MIDIKNYTAPPKTPHPGRPGEDLRALIEPHNLLALLDYWQSKHGSNGSLPSRRDIDPIEIPHLLPVIYMLDVVKESGDLRFKLRLVGTRVVEWCKRDATGLFLDSPEYALNDKSELDDFKRIVETRTPEYVHLYEPHHEEAYRHYSQLTLPLADRDGTVNILLCGLHVRSWADIPVRPENFR